MIALVNTLNSGRHRCLEAIWSSSEATSRLGDFSLCTLFLGQISNLGYGNISRTMQGLNF